MVDPLLAAINTPKGNGIADNTQGHYREKIQAQWSDVVDSARAVLKTDDKLSWYLRLSIAAMVGMWVKALDPMKVNQLRGEYTIDDAFVLRNGESLKQLERFLSLPIPAIQSYKFRSQPFSVVIAQLSAIEAKSEKLNDLSQSGWMAMLDEPTPNVKAILQSIVEDNNTALDVIADKVGTRPESAIAALIHMFPNSLTAIFKEVRADIQEQAKTGGADNDDLMDRADKLVIRHIVELFQ